MHGEFKGEYSHTVDGKGRVAIPARFRSRLEGGAVLARSTEQCLCIYPTETWERKSAGLDTAENVAPSRLERFERRTYRLALDIELDAQGRILIPLKHRQYAEIGGEAVIVGARDRFEIWGAERWDAYITELEAEDFSDMRF